MLSLGEMEFEFWERFSQIEEEDCSDDKGNAPVEVTQSLTFKRVRLSHEDMHLFGAKPDPEFFTVVTCDFCGMVLKPQALHEHILKRHNFSPLSEDVVMLNEYSAQTNEKPTVKKRKLNPGACLRVESQHLVSTQSMILKNPPSSIQYLQSTKSLDQFRMPPIRKLKMKLKKTTQGMWSVLPAC